MIAKRSHGLNRIQRLAYNHLGMRVFRLISTRKPWYDWGGRLMILVGQDQGGNYSEPEPVTWWYRLGPPKRMWFTGYPRHPLSTFEVVKDLKTFRALTEGLNDDQMYEWKAMSTSQDGELILGHRYWGGNFYGLTKSEVALLRRYLRHWRRIDWFGLRSWLFLVALHAAVHTKKPFACNVTPARGSGGYSHWNCHEKRKHDGPHIFNNYTWVEGEHVNHEPRDRMES